MYKNDYLQRNKYRLNQVKFLPQGKGTITTYFLIGYKGFNKPLPSLEKAAAENEHSFKWSPSKSDLLYAVDALGSKIRKAVSKYVY